MILNLTLRLMKIFGRVSFTFSFCDIYLLDVNYFVQIISTDPTRHMETPC